MANPDKPKKQKPAKPEVLSDFTASIREHRSKVEESPPPAIALEILGEPVLWQVVTIDDAHFMEMFVPWSAGESTDLVGAFESLLAPSALAEWREAKERNDGRYPLGRSEMRQILYATTAKLLEIREEKSESSAD